MPEPSSNGRFSPPTATAQRANVVAIDLDNINQPQTQTATINEPASTTNPMTNAAAQTGVVAAVCVTWNRKEDVLRVLHALSKQTYPLERLHIVIIDNASTDGTLEAIKKNFNPDRVVHNNTDKAHEPNFAEPILSSDAPSSNTGGFASLTVVRNSANHGGCGGFNTGFAYAEHAFTPEGKAFDTTPKPTGSAEFIWLVDDDVDLPTNLLENLVAAARTDDNIALVGSRTVDLQNRETTIETTIYFDDITGFMGPDPRPGHRLEQSHKQWASTVGGPKYGGPYSGLRDVDVVSACSMLARWKDIREVGFWDWRYFIYCDDADWCLRFGKAGKRVVLNLDAVVFHTPWFNKLTPARAYYAQRNAVWMATKTLEGTKLRKVVSAWMKRLLRSSLKELLYGRLHLAKTYRLTALDAATNKPGKFEYDMPIPGPTGDIFNTIGLLSINAVNNTANTPAIAAICASTEAIAKAAELIARIQKSLDTAGKKQQAPRLVICLNTDLAQDQRAKGELAKLPKNVEILTYVPTWKGRLAVQRKLKSFGVSAVLVYDYAGDLPVWSAKYTIFADSAKPDTVSAERVGIRKSLAELARLAVAAARCFWYARTVKPHTRSGRYG